MSIVLKVLFVELQHHFLDLAHWPVSYTNFKRIRARIRSGDDRKSAGREAFSCLYFREGCIDWEVKLSYFLKVF